MMLLLSTASISAVEIDDDTNIDTIDNVKKSDVNNSNNADDSSIGSAVNDNDDNTENSDASVSDESEVNNIKKVNEINKNKITNKTDTTIKTTDSVDTDVTSNTSKTLNSAKSLKTTSTVIDVSSYAELYGNITRYSATESAGDVIINLLDGDYTVTQQINVTSNITNLTINGNSQVIDGQSTCHFMTVEEDASVIINNLTITNCQGTEPLIMSAYSRMDVGNIDEDTTVGGALLNRGTLVVNNVTFTFNNATRGGAIFNRGPLVIENCTFRNNSAVTRGGAMDDITGETLVKNNVFINNTAEDGGAIYDLGQLLVCNNTFINNKVTNVGGDIYIANGQSQVINNSFVSNNATYGGAIYNNLDDSDIINNSFITNNATRGAAIFNNGTMDVINNTFIGNTATLSGGAIYDRGNLTIENCTFINNTSGTHGGAVNMYDVVNLTNCIFINNTAQDGGAIFSNGTLTIRDTTFDSNHAMKDVIRIGDNEYEGDGGAINSLGEIYVYTSKFYNNTATSEGGAIYAYKESFYMEIHDSIFEANVAGTEGGAVDSHGMLRTENTMYINNTANTIGNAINSNSSSTYVRNCSFINNTGQNGTVYNHGKLYVSNSTFINNSVTGTGAAIYNNKDLTDVENSIFINNTAQTTGGSINSDIGQVNVTNCTFINGSSPLGGAICGYSGSAIDVVNSTFTNNAANTGGAISLSTGTLSINNSKFTGNHVVDGGNGGVLYVTNAKSSIINATFENNFANGSAGSIYFRASTVNITDSLFKNNTANEIGVIYIVNSGNVTIYNTAFYSNSAKGYGGVLGIYSITKSDVTISDCVFGNNSGKDGGAIRSDGANVTISDCDFGNNSAADSGGTLYFKTGTVGICGSNFVNSASSNLGGVLISYGGKVTIGNSSFTNGSSKYGGVIYQGSSNITIENSTFANNTATSYGGVIEQAGGRLEAVNNSFTDNSAEARGGVIYSAATASISNNIFTNSSVRNSWSGGGALFVTNAANINVKNNAFYNSSSAQYGGAISQAGGTLELTNNSFINSSAKNRGGAVYQAGGTLKVNNDTFTNNSATNNGAAIYISSSTASVKNSTFIKNSETSGYTIYNDGDLSISNNTFINNTKGRDILFNQQFGINEKTLASENIYTGNELATQIVTDLVETTGSEYKYNITVKAYDVYNTTVKSGSITVTVNGATYGAYSADGNNISVSIPYADLNAENNIVKVRYASANTDYQSSSTSLRITKVTTSNVVVKNSTVTNVTFDVQVENDVTGSIPNGTVIIYANGTQVGNGTLDSTGGISNLKTNISKAGNYSIRIDYEGNDYYQASNYTFNLEVMPIATVIDAEIINNTYGNVTVKVTVCDGEGNPIENARVLVQADNNMVSVGFTNGDGIVILNVNKTTSSQLPIGEYALYINFTGQIKNGEGNLDDGVYNASNKTLDLTVIRPTTVTINSLNNTATNVTINVAVKDTSSEDLVSEGTIKLYANGELVGEGEVADGHATIKTNITINGTYALEAIYSGSDRYASSTSEEYSIGVTTRTAVIDETIIEHTVDNTQINVLLTDDAGNKLIGASVNITDENCNLLAQGTTDSSGEVALSFQLSATPEQHLIINYGGNNTYANCSKDIYVDINRLNTTIAADYVNNTAGNVIINVNVTKKDSTVSVTDGKVYIYNGTALVGSGELTGVGSVNITAGLAIKGDYSLTIVYEGNGKYNSSNIAYQFNVIPRPTVVNITAVNTTIDNVIVKVTLSDADGTVLPNASVNIADGNGNVLATGETLNDGTVEIKVSDLSLGETTLYVVYNGNDTYNMNSNSTAFDVTKRNTIIKAGYINSTVGNVTINVNVTDEDGNKVTGGNILVYDYDKVLVGEGTLNGDGSINITTNITSRYSGYGTTPYQHVLTIEYLGTDNYYNESADTTKFVVQARTSSIEAAVTNTTIGNVTMEVKVTDGYNGSALNNASVNIVNAEGTVIASGYTNETGIATIAIPDLSLSEVTLNAVYSGNSSLKIEGMTYTGSSTSVAFTVVKRNTAVAANAINGTAGNVTVSVIVTDGSTGSGVTGGTVEVYNGAVLVGAGSVDGDGSVNITTDVIIKGDYTLTIKYLGTDDYYNGNETTCDVSVTTRPTTISYVPVNNTVGNTSLEVTLYDADGTVLPNASVNIADANGNVLAEGTTSTDGTIALNITALSATKHNLNINYGGNDTYSNYTLSIQVDVEKRPTTTQYEVLNNTALNTTIKVTVVDATNGSLVNEGSIEILDQDSLKVVGEGTLVDGVVIITTDIAAQGNYDLNIRYISNDYYMASTNITKAIEVALRDTQISIDVLNSTVDNVTVKVTVKDADGTVLPNALVNIADSTGKVLANGTASSDGIASIVIPNLAVGDTALTAVYGGNDTYNKSSIGAAFAVDRRNAVVAANAINGTAGNVTLNVIVTDGSTGSGATGGTVQVYNGAVLVGAGSVDGDGSVNITTDVIIKGDYTLTIKYLGTDDYYNGNETTCDVSVTTRPTTITYELTDSTIESAKITVYLKDANGTVMPNAQVSIKDSNDNLLGQIGTTDEFGKAVINIAAGLNAGDNDIKIIYNGNDTYANCAVMPTVSINRRNVAMEIIPANATATNTTVKVQVLDALNSSEVLNGEVTLYVNDEVLETKNINNGIVEFKTSIDKKGTYTIKAAYSQTETYNANAVSKDIEVTTRNTSISFKLSDATIGNTKVNVTLTDDMNQAIGGAEVIIKDADGNEIGSATTGGDGKVEVTLDDALSAASNKITAIYGGNYTYSSSQYSNDITVAKRNATISYGILNQTATNATLNITVYDTTSNNPVSEGKVIIYANDTNVGEGTLRSGSVTVLTNIAEAGTYNVKIVYLENDYYSQNATQVFELAVGLKGSLIYHWEILHANPHMVVVQVILTDDEYKRIANAPITISNSTGSQVVTNNTDSEGIALLYFSNATVGENSIRIDYYGNETYGPCYDEGILGVERHNTTISYTVLNNTAGNVTLNIGVVHNHTQEPVDDGLVYIYNGTDEVGAGKISSNGFAAIKTNIAVKGSYALTIHYIGTQDYNESYATTDEFEVVPRSTATNVDIINDTVGNVTIKVAVIDDDTGNALPGAFINITNAQNEVLANATALDDGSAIITVPNLSINENELNITYIGNDTYATSYNKTIVNVLKRTTEISYNILNNTACNVTIEVNVTDITNSSKVTIGTIEIYDGTDLVGGGSLNSDGTANIATSIAAGNDYALTIRYAGTDDFYNETSKDVAVQVLTRNTTLTYKVTNSTIGSTRITTALYDADGTVISNKEVYIYNESGDAIAHNTTDSNGIAAFAITEGLVAGDNDIKIVFDGDDTYANCTIAPTITLNKRGIAVDIIPINTTATNVTINVTVADAINNDKLSKGNIALYANDTIVGNGTIHDGVVEIKTNITKQGTYTFKAVYSGDGIYESNYKAKELIIAAKDTGIKATQTNETIGNTKVNVTLADIDGNNIADAWITITNSTNDIIGQGITKSDGSIEIDTALLPSGATSVNIAYAGSDTYANSTMEFTINVVKRNTAMEYNPVNATATNATIGIKVVDTTSNTPATGGNVIIYANDTIVGNSTISNDGLANILTNITESGTYSMKIVYAGNDYYNQSSTREFSLTIDKVPTNIECNPYNNTIGNTSIIITLADADGNPIRDALVNVTDSTGVFLTEGRTLDNGIVILNTTALPYGDNNIIINYGGNDTYDAASYSTAISVDKRLTAIQYEVLNNTALNATIKVAVFDSSNGSMVQNGTVRIYNGTNPVGEGTITDGIIIIKTNIAVEGDYNLNINYLGNDYYRSSETTAETITASTKPTVISSWTVDHTIHNTVISVLLTDDELNHLSDANIIIEYDGKSVSNITADGIARFNITDLPAGHDSITIKYNGNGTYSPAESMTYVDVNRINTEISATPINNTAGNVTIRVNVNDAEGNVVDNGTVHILSNNKIVGSGDLTDGQSHVDIVASIATKDHYALYIKYLGTSDYNQSSIVSDIDVIARNTTATLNVVNQTFGNITVHVTVVDKTTGTGLINASVNIADSTGKVLANGTTDKSGIAIINVPDLDVGSAALKAVYGGNDTYGSSFDNEEFEVLNHATEISYAILNNTATNTTIEVNVLDIVGGDVVNGGIVEIYNGVGLVGSGNLNSDGTVNVTTSIAIKGDYTLNIKYKGHDYFNESGVTTDSFIVTARNTALNTTVVSNVVGNVAVNVNLTDDSNKPVSNADIEIRNSTNDVIGHGTTDINGAVSITLDKLLAGDNTITIVYGGNDTYGNYAQAMELDVAKHNTTTQYNVLSTVIGNVTIEVMVSDTTNSTNIVNEGIVEIYEGNAIIGGGTVNNGVVTIKTSIGTVDAHEINIKYEGTADYYNSSQNSTTIETSAKTPSIKYTVSDNIIGNTIIEVNVTYDSEPVEGIAVEIMDSKGNIIGSGITGSNGIVDVLITDLPAGKDTITIECEGNDIYSQYSMDADITVVKKELDVVITELNRTVGNTVIEINVTEKGTNMPVSADVDIILPNGDKISTKTNESGLVDVKIPTNQHGDVTITIDVVETDEYTGKVTIKTIAVERYDVSVTLEDSQMYILDYSNITVNVTDEAGNPVNGGYIIFKVNGKTLQSNGGFTVESDDSMKINVVKGSATIVFNATSFYNKTGVNSIIVKYSGTPSKYNAASSENKTLTINKRLAYVELTANQTSYKLYDTVNVTAACYDITHGEKTALYSDNSCYAIYKINGITSKVNGDTEKFNITNSTVTIDTNSQSKLNYICFNYTAPGKNTANSTIEVKIQNKYYNIIANATTFNLEQTEVNIDVINITHNKTSKTVTISANINDINNNAVIGMNSYCVKINNITCNQNKTNGTIFYAQDGKIYLTLNATSTNIRNVEIVTGARYAYAGSRKTITNIKVVT